MLQLNYAGSLKLNFLDKIGEFSNLPLLLSSKIWIFNLKTEVDHQASRIFGVKLNQYSIVHNFQIDFSFNTFKLKEINKIGNIIDYKAKNKAYLSYW